MGKVLTYMQNHVKIVSIYTILTWEDLMDIEKHIKFTKDEIQKYLDKLKNAINNLRVIISKRDINNKLIEDYSLKEKNGLKC